MSKKLNVAGVDILADERCPRCGGTTFRKPCPCFMRNRGWATCAKCLNPKCSHTFGVAKADRRGKVLDIRRGFDGFAAMLRDTAKKRRQKR